MDGAMAAYESAGALTLGFARRNGGEAPVGRHPADADRNAWDDLHRHSAIHPLPRRICKADDGESKGFAQLDCAAGRPRSERDDGYVR